MHIKTIFQGKIEDHKEAAYRLKLIVHEMYLFCEPLFGHGNTFDRGLPVFLTQQVGTASNVVYEYAENFATLVMKRANRSNYICFHKTVGGFIKDEYCS
jgi:hypothetical protein